MAKDIIKIGLSVLLGVIAINFLWSIATDLGGLLSVLSAYILASSEVRGEALQQWLPQIKMSILSMGFRLLLIAIIALIVKSFIGSYMGEEEG